jgi:hypothetical protein
MNKSYSKIRHIQEANLMLEKRGLVKNNRSFLMEQTIENEIAPLFVNEFNRVMAAYKTGDKKILTYTAQYVKGDDNYHGKIGIYADGKLKLTSLKDFGVAVTAPVSTGIKDEYGTDIGVLDKLMLFRTGLLSQIDGIQDIDNTVKSYLKTAVRSGIDTTKLNFTQKK